MEYLKIQIILDYKIIIIFQKRSYWYYYYYWGENSWALFDLEFDDSEIIFEKRN